MLVCSASIGALTNATPAFQDSLQLIAEQYAAAQH